MVSLDRQLGHLAGRAEHRDVTRTGGDAGRPAVDPPNQRGGGESDSVPVIFRAGCRGLHSEGGSSRGRPCLVSTKN